MKKSLLFIILMCVSLANSQTQFEVRLASAAAPLTFSDGKSQPIADEVSTIIINCKDCSSDAAKAMSFTVFINGTSECNGFRGSDLNAVLKCGLVNDLRGQPIQIRDATGKKPLFSFVLIKNTSGSLNPSGNGQPQMLPKIEDFVQSLFPVIVPTLYGMQLPTGSEATKYSGKKYVHIFLDQFGNPIFTTMPQGISNNQYIVHVFYMEKIGDESQTTYSVNQTSGEFQDALVFRNSGGFTDLDLRSEKNPSNYKWSHREFLLRTSTNDITFEVIRTSQTTANPNEIQSSILKTHVIKMSKVYHGSFDVGLVKTTLENPDYELLQSASDPEITVVKRLNDGPRGVVTAMATFYTSPIVLIEWLAGNRDIPKYKLTGRNFLDDHKMYERIYPSVGIGFTDKTLENLFYGLNWEFSRGGAVFAGYHYGKVNTFDTGENLVFGETPVSEASFNLRRNTEWKTAFAFGLKLDIMIVRNLFKATASE